VTLPNPGLGLGCFNFVIVLVVAWTIVWILGLKWYGRGHGV